MPTIWAARPRKRAPVPWVPVEVAPAMVCRSMSPMFSSARPCGSSSAGSWYRFVPAPSVDAVPRGVDVQQPVDRADVDAARPTVAAMSVKLWPAPTAFTVSPRSRAAATTATTSSTLVGRAR